MSTTEHVAPQALPLRDLRTSAGLTQQQLAFAAGVASTTVNRIETGLLSPRESTKRVLALALSEAMGVAPEQVVLATNENGQGAANALAVEKRDVPAPHDAA